MTNKSNEELAKEVGIDNIDESIKIGSKEEAEWKRILMQTEASISQSKKTIILNEALIPFINKKIDEERAKFLKKK